MNNVRNIEKLMENSKKLHALEGKYKINIDDPRCDKFGFAFGGDSRFSVFSFSLFLDCHTGHFGNSSCSTLMSLDSDIVEKHFNIYLNKHKSKILQEVADSISIEASSLADEAVKELAERMDKIKGFKK